MIDLLEISICKWTHVTGAKIELKLKIYQQRNENVPLILFAIPFIVYSVQEETLKLYSDDEWENFAVTLRAWKKRSAVLIYVSRPAIYACEFRVVCVCLYFVKCWNGGIPLGNVCILCNVYCEFFAVIQANEPFL